MSYPTGGAGSAAAATRSRETSRCLPRWIGRGFKPALRRQDVIPLVAVDVASADAVTVTPCADNALGPHSILQVVPGQRRFGGAGELWKEVVGLPVVVEIDEEGEFGWTDGVDEVLRPLAIGLAGFFIHTMRRAK